MKKKTVELFIRIFLVLKPPPEMTLSEWADRFARIPAGTSAEPGRWRTSKVPYQREIMDAITDIAVKKVVIMSAAQIGKTAIIINVIGYYVHYDPSPIMVIQPTIDMAEKFSKEKFSPVLRDTPVLAERINDKSRNSGNTIMQKNFPGGFVTIAGANSPTGSVELVQHYPKEIPVIVFSLSMRISEITDRQSVRFSSRVNDS